MPIDVAGTHTAMTAGDRSGIVARKVLVGSLVACAVAAVVFLAFPQIDLWASRSLYHSGLDTEGRILWLNAARYGMAAVFWAAAAAAVGGLVVSSIRRVGWLGLSASRWLFICLCLVVGPGLVANSLLKDNWGRARPRQIAEFGGDRVYTPPLVPANQCQRNCSFVSGEASAVFAPFYAAALVVPQSSVLLLAVGTLAGLGAGLVRMSQGAHFLSDVVFAGLFMALTAALLHRLMFAGFERKRPAARP